MSCVNVHVADSVQVKCMELFIYMYVLLLGECAIIMRTLLFNSLNKHENVFWHIYLFIFTVQANIILTFHILCNGECLSLVKWQTNIIVHIIITRHLFAKLLHKVLKGVTKQQGPCCLQTTCSLTRTDTSPHHYTVLLYQMCTLQCPQSPLEYDVMH